MSTADLIPSHSDPCPPPTPFCSLIRPTQFIAAAQRGHIQLSHEECLMWITAHSSWAPKDWENIVIYSVFLWEGASSLKKELGPVSWTMHRKCKIKSNHVHWLLKSRNIRKKIFMESILKFLSTQMWSAWECKDVSEAVIEANSKAKGAETGLQCSSRKRTPCSKSFTVRAEQWKGWSKSNKSMLCGTAL